MAGGALMILFYAVLIVRQAINYAIDRQRFTETVMKGFTGEPRALPWAKSSPESAGRPPTTAAPG